MAFFTFCYMSRTAACHPQAFLFLTDQWLCSLVLNSIPVNSISAKIIDKQYLIILRKNWAMCMRTSLPIRISTSTLMHNKTAHFTHNILHKFIHDKRATGIIDNNNPIASLINRNMARVIAIGLHSFLQIVLWIDDI